MEKITTDQLIKSFPYSVRFEILKKQLEDIYFLEYHFLEVINKNGIDFYDQSMYDRTQLCKKYDYDTNYAGNNTINYKIKVFLVTIEKADLPNDMLIELYEWAKKRRKELYLKDNLFNLFDEYIFESYKYKELNKKTNGK